MNKEKCIVCNSGKIMPIIKIAGMPTFCNVLLSSKEQALNVVKGDLDMFFCMNCGHVFNNAFDYSILSYSEDYDNTLHYSPKFQAFAEKLVDHLIETYNLKGKNIIDIGCGKGDFLNLICKLGENHGIGFDASYQKERSEENPNVRFVKDFFNDKYADLPVDLVSCRHVLEHIEDPKEFLLGIIKAVGKNNPIFYIEVPNALYTIKDMGIWDLIYEHVSYFTKESIQYLFNSCGLKILDISEDFGGQYLLVEAAIGKAKENKADTEQLRLLIDKFSSDYVKKKDYWKKFIEDNEGKRIVVWGAGSKGVTFLNILEDKKAIEYIVDLNPHKCGKYVPGAGTKVIAPEFLKEYKPDIVILMNALYEEEVRKKLTSLGLESEIVLG
ncbi:TPA: class I SAM-dependent methyltransferase, partial [Candidatus Woesearchaeota archaeon]|nr:class I SAM-dependent methyltransferase [Candidatus Woesearchaeota archaeon]